MMCLVILIYHNPSKDKFYKSLKNTIETMILRLTVVSFTKSVRKSQVFPKKVLNFTNDLYLFKKYLTYIQSNLLISIHLNNFPFISSFAIIFPY